MVTSTVATDRFFLLRVQNIGGAFGGSDFNPYNKSETEIQRFCQSYMTELSKYIGNDIDLPGTGDGCGPPEIGYMCVITCVYSLQ